MGTESSALAVNDSDIVVGYGTLNAIGSTYGAFKWTSGGGIMQLGQLFAYDTRAQDINNLGDAVGWSWIDGMGNSRAVLWKGGGPIANLNDLIDPTSGWLLTSATGINDAGQIVGVGQHNGQGRAFLLTPIPEPSTTTTAVWTALLLSLHWPIRRQ
jgi:probable HAF family extracellular repeat protein